ncbi:MAG: hypothetical protein OHK0039_40720 [Bacteroidia bacterium]
MNRSCKRIYRQTAALAVLLALLMPVVAQPDLRLNALEYLEMEGLNVMLAHDFYPESHQGGVGIIQNGLRVATNGDLRLEPTPGQWQPVPAVGPRQVDAARQEIAVHMRYPDSTKDRKGFNPILYPDLELGYTLRVQPEGAAFRIIVDLDAPLPAAWVGRVGMNIELFPGILFGKTFATAQDRGIFPRQQNSDLAPDAWGELQARPLAEGRVLHIAPESDTQRMTIEVLAGGPLALIDGRAQHNNGWYVVRALVPAGATREAIVWRVSPHAIPGWRHVPVVQVSQVGYHPQQAKVAVIELDPLDNRRLPVELLRVGPGGLQPVLQGQPQDWGRFLRYHYLRFDFSRVREPGMYVLRYGDYQTHAFQIDPRAYDAHVWQPTVAYFLPVQMCHMRINDRYKVWHDFCHLDDARMAPVGHNHFDGYLQGPTTLTRYQPGEVVPGLNRGGWHDAGDYDLRVESQASTVQGLAHAYELFRVEYDQTSIDQRTRVVEIHRPDGKPDLLQQVEHGVLTIAGGYQALGRLYRGIICPDLRQYVLLGDASAMTDNLPYDPKQGAGIPIGLPGSPDDRWVFTEDNPGRELQTAGALAAAARVLRGYDDSLAAVSLQIAQALWRDTQARHPLQKVEAAVELLLTTGDAAYAGFLRDNQQVLAENFDRVGWIAGRSMQAIPDTAYRGTLARAAARYRARIDSLAQETPYGVPYRPHIWGAGWGIQQFGVEQLFLHLNFPQSFGDTYLYQALNFILGCHPGSNTASFVSGVGSRSLTVAYGVNRDEWSYIPGGSGSGTALIRPDYPELLTWPYLWQQTEYVLGGGTTDYLLLALAAQHLLDR